MNSSEKYFNELLRICSAVKENFVQFSTNIRLSRTLNLENVYIPLRLESFPLPRSAFDEDYTALKNRIQSMEDWIAGFLGNEPLAPCEPLAQPAKKSAESLNACGKRILLIAEPGAGKSTFLNRLCMAYLNYEKDKEEQTYIAALKVNDSAVFSKAARLPLLLTARSLSDMEPEEMRHSFLSIAYRCFTQLTDSDLPQNAFETCIKKHAHSGTCVILIDGLDEIFQPKKETLLLNSLRVFLEEYPQCDLVVTSRLLNHYPNLFKNYMTIGLQHLDSDSIDSFCKQWCSLVLDDSTSSEEISKSISHSNDETIRQLSRLPLTLSHLLTVFSMEDGLPSNKAVLYERICQWYIRWNKRRKGITLLPSTMTKLLAYIAFAFTTRGWFSCTTEQLHQLLFDAMKDLKYDLDERLSDNKIEDYIEQFSNLALFGKVGDSFSFLMHRQIQEYLTALAIDKKYLDKAHKILKPNEIFGDKYSGNFWHEIIVFYILITEYIEKKDAIINDIILLTQEDNDNSAYESLLLDILSNNVRTPQTEKMLDALFSESINPQKIKFLYHLTLSKSITYDDTKEYLFTRLQSDIQNNLILQPKYKFGIGYAVGVIRAGELMNEGINPLEYAEQNLNSEDQLEEFLSKMILGIMLWTKCNDIRTDFSSCINEYSFHSLPVLREKLKTNRNDYPLGDLLQELILSNTIATTEVFDTPTTLELIASLSSCDTLTETQIAILSVMPFNDSMPALSLSHGAKEALLESFETAESKNNLRKLIYLFSACYHADCFENRYAVSKRFTTIVDRYASSGFTEQENLLTELKQHIPLVEHYYTSKGEHFAATYFGELSDADPKTFITNRNNLAYCLRRKELEAVYLFNSDTNEAQELSVHDLLKDEIEGCSAFGIINYALFLSDVHKDEVGGDIQLGQTFLKEHLLTDSITLIDAVFWWKQLADKQELEGKIVLSWLYHSGYEEELSQVLSPSDVTEAASFIHNFKSKKTDYQKGNTFTILSDGGEEIECEILFTFENNNKNYIVYTNNNEDEEGNTEVFASVFDPTQENPVLQPIETEKEWTLIEELLEELN